MFGSVLALKGPFWLSRVHFGFEPSILALKGAIQCLGPFWLSKRAIHSFPLSHFRSVLAFNRAIHSFSLRFGF